MKSVRPSSVVSSIFALTIAATCALSHGATIGMYHADEADAYDGKNMTKLFNTATVASKLTNGDLNGTIKYSNDAAASQIYDPVSGATYSNNYSALMSGGGVNAFKVTTNSALTDANSASTIEFFIKVTNGSDDTSGVTFGSGVAGNKIAYRNYQDNRWNLGFVTGQSLRLYVTGGATINTNGAVSDGQWHHIAVTFDQSGSTNIATLYLDGVSSGSTTYTGTITAGNMMFGPSDNSPANVNYRMDEIRYSSGILTPSQFLQAVPEPASLGILVLSGMMLWAAGKKKRS